MSPLNIIPKKIFIAGSTGMVGKAIYRALMNSSKYSNSENYEILNPNRRELDLSDFSAVYKWFQINKPSIVIIAAAKVGGILANKNNPVEFILENLKIQTNLIENSWKFGVEKLIFLGSSCIYPKFASQPIKEEELLTNTLEKTNEFYAIAKIAGIKLCESLIIQHSFKAICLMPTNLYGPGDNYNLLNSHVLPAMIRKFSDAKENGAQSVKLWGSGKALREFLYVEDLADACIFILENWFKEDNLKINKNMSWINIGSNFEVSIKELAFKISDIIGYDGEILWDESKPDGTPRKKLDSSKINKLGWQATTNLNDGIKKTIASYNSEIKNKVLRK